MTETEKTILIGGGGAAVALILAWLYFRQGAPAPSNVSISPPGSPTNPAPGVFNINGGNLDISMPAPPASVFNIGGATVNAPNSTTINLPAAPGSADGATGPCNCPGGGSSQAGSSGAQAAALAPLVAYLTQFLPTGIAAPGAYQFGGESPEGNTFGGGPTESIFKTMMAAWKMGNNIFAPFYGNHLNPGF